MIFDFSTAELLVITAVAVAAAIVAGSAGIGVGLIASPVLLSMDTDFAPGPLLLGSLVISLRHVAFEFNELDREALQRALIGLPFGLAAAIAVLHVMQPSTLAFAIGIFICIASGLLLAGFRPARSALIDVLSGAGCAFTSSAAALPGPPLVIGFSDLSPKCLRCTISVFIIIVSVCSTVAWIAIDRFGGRELELTATLLPGLLSGLFLSRWTRPFLDRSWFRPAVLTLALIGGALLAFRQL